MSATHDSLTVTWRRPTNDLAAAASLTGADISFTGKIEKASQHLAYDAAKGALFYDDDGTGAHAAVLIATLAGAPALALADFALIA